MNTTNKISNYFQTISAELNDIADKNKAEILQRFFKTGPGEYGEGDKFIGVMVPVSRRIAVKYKEAPFQDISLLFKSGIHEFRLVAIFILVHRFEKSSDEKEKTEIFNYYLKNTKYINNWDLVDLSAPRIVGGLLLNYKNIKERNIFLNTLVKSKSLWERRIAVLATFYFLKDGRSTETYSLAKKLFSDKNDLIQKAVGWMLREAGKRVSEPELLKFLDANISRMPRTMLRYSIERLPEDLRKSYLYCRF